MEFIYFYACYYACLFLILAPAKLTINKTQKKEIIIAIIISEV